jgi:hypothetical protein
MSFAGFERILEIGVRLTVVALLLAMNNPSVCDQNPSQEEVQCGKM